MLLAREMWATVLFVRGISIVRTSDPVDIQMNIPMCV